MSYHCSPIPMSMRSLKKIGQKVLMLEHENKALSDRQMDGQMTDGHSKFRGYNMIIYINQIRLGAHAILLVLS